MARLQTDDRDDLTGETFAFPHQRKEPLEDASHVRNAIARFDQVEGVTDAERDAAWKRILSAAEVRRRGAREGLARAAEAKALRVALHTPRTR